MFTETGRPRSCPTQTVVLTLGEAEYRAFIEVDMGTMSTTRLAQKLGGYAAYVRLGAWRERHPFCPVLLFLTITEARAERVVKKFEEKWRWEERHSKLYDTPHRLQAFFISSCSAARNPEMAVREPVWITRDGLDGLTLEELLQPTWEAFRQEQERQRAVEEERRAELARLRSDPEARRAQIQGSAQALHSHKQQLIDLDGQRQQVMEELIEGKEPISAAGRAAFRFFEARVAHQESGTAPRQAKPPTRPEARAIDALVAERLEAQRQRVAGLYARYPHLPCLLRAIQELSADNLLGRYIGGHLSELVREDLKALKKHKGRALSRNVRDGPKRCRWSTVLDGKRTRPIRRRPARRAPFGRNVGRNVGRQKPARSQSKAFGYGSAPGPLHDDVLAFEQEC